MDIISSPEVAVANHPKERQIAPSAAVFFASLNKRDDVLYWLQKAIDAKAPRGERGFLIFVSLILIFNNLQNQ